MAKGRDRPRKEPKRKKQPKAQAAPASPVTPSYQPPMRQVEVIKPRRKEREPERESEAEPREPIPPEEE